MIKDRSINIMHISDLHFGIENTKGQDPAYLLERKQIIKAFHDYFNRIPTEWRPQIIAITGDLGWIGCESDYELFADFLKRLLDNTNLTIDKVICCPGNHDKEVTEEVNGIEDFYSIERVWPEIDELSGYFRHYINSLKKNNIVPCRNGYESEEVKYLYGYRVIEDICFMVLNSAWLCDWRKDKKGYEADKGRLVLDKSVVSDAMLSREKEVEEVEKKLTVSLFHHPQPWLRTTEYSSPDLPPCAFSRISNITNVFLTGHEHDSRSEHNRYMLAYSAGTLSSKDVVNSKCRIIKIHVDDSNKELSMVDTGVYYSQWNEKGVEWNFRLDERQLPINAHEYGKFLSKENIILTEHLEKRASDKRLEEKLHNLDIKKNIEKIKKAYEKLEYGYEKLQEAYGNNMPYYDEKMERLNGEKAKYDDILDILAYILTITEEILDKDIEQLSLPDFLKVFSLIWERLTKISLEKTENNGQNKMLRKDIK